jgi:hypothetical protein
MDKGNGDVCIIDRYGNNLCDKINKSISDRIFYDFDHKNYAMKSNKILKIDESADINNSSENSELVKLYGSNRWYLEGIFTITNKVNRNGNLYVNDIVAPEVIRYSNENILGGYALGETLHPIDRDIVDPDLASVKCIKYERESPTSDIYIGKLLVLNTRKGRTISDLLDDHVTLSVSTRSLGLADSVMFEGKMVEKLTLWDLLAPDIVLDPSVMEAVMQAIREGRYVNKDLLKKRQNEQFRKRMDENVIKNRFNEVMKKDEFVMMMKEIFDVIGEN